MKRTLYSCRCGSLEHIFIVSADESDAFIEIHLAPLPIWQRIWNAVRYAFGHRSKYGDFQEILLSPETALYLGDQLVNWANGPTEFQPNDVF